MTYLQAEKKRQTEWKLTTKYLSREAKKPGLFRSRLFLSNVNDKEGLKQLLQPAFPDMAALLPIEHPDQYLSFEWIPPKNYLQEELHTDTHDGFPQLCQEPYYQLFRQQLLSRHTLLRRRGPVHQARFVSYR